MRELKNDIIEILEKNSRINNEQIASMLGISIDDVKNIIKELEDSGVILGYSALVDWEKTEKEVVSAFIEVKVTPQRDRGFDKIAEKIITFPQVVSLNLMSGGYDLFVLVEGKSMKEVALFVAEKLATEESVLSTATHFVLKKYKEKGVIFTKKNIDNREAVVL